MTPFLLYIARAGLYLAVFFAFYLLVMRRTTFFRLNRALLLAGSYLCLILPFIRLRTASEAAGIAHSTAVTMNAQALLSPEVSPFPWGGVMLGIYLLGAVVTLSLYVVSAWRMGRIIRSGASVKRNGCTLVLLDGNVPSFSWARKVVMSRHDLEQNPAIFTHELMHVRHRHSADLVLFLPLQALFWWNPLTWIAREELRLLHEFEADEDVIKNGIDVTQYQLLLVRKAAGEKRFSLASGFQHAKLKNRITMMLKSNSSSWMRWSYLAIIPILALFMFACNPARHSKNQKDAAAVTETEPAQEAVPFQLAEDKPSFNGGDANEFSMWVYSQIKYPEEAKKNQIQGRVLIQFTVGSDGVVCDVNVLRGVHELIDAEAVRVVSSSPKWEPGRQDGKAVPVRYTFPVIFKLQ